MAAAATSFLCDDYATAPAAAPRFTRWFEGLAIAAVLAGTAYFVWRALPHTVIQPDRIPRLEVFLPVAVLIGVIIGASVPTWYRAALGRRQANLIAAASADRADDGRASVPSQPVPAE
jgi:hypothetical protein